MRLFRQSKRGDWVSVFEQVKKKLQAVLAGEAPIFSVEEVKTGLQVEKVKSLVEKYTGGQKCLKPDLNISSFSVVVPVFNCEKQIIKTLDSINISIKFFNENFPRSQEVTAEIIVVNDASTDNSLSLATEFASQNPLIKIVNQLSNRGAAAARNIGTKNSQGNILFFCDGDDLFLPEHIYICFMLLQGKSEGKASFKLVNDNYNLTINFPEERIDVVRTGVKTEDELHPYWKAAIENSIPLNLCVRRECHEPDNLPIPPFQFSQEH